MPPMTRSGSNHEEDGNGAGASSGLGASALFAPVQHPVLRSVDTIKGATFLRERERYVDEVLEKQKEVPSMSVASFKVSVDRSLLKMLHKLGDLDSVAGLEFVDLESEHIEAYVKSIIATRKDEDIDPRVIEDALKGVRMPMSISDPKARVLQYVHNVFQRLEGVGYGNFKERNPKNTVKLLQERLYPPHLKGAMESQLEYQPGLGKNVKAYVAMLRKEAVIQARLNSGRGKNEKDVPQNSTASKGARANKEKKGSKSTKDSKGDSHTHTPDNNAPELPCLNEECKAKGLRHKGGVRNCPKTSPEKAKELIRELMESKRQKAKHVTSRKGLDVTTEDGNSTIMGVTFAGIVQTKLCADGGSDINLLPSTVFVELVEGRAEMNVKELERPRKFALAASEMYVTCNREVEINTELKIRHGKALMIRNLRWLVAVEPVDEPLLGRPIQEALGLDTKKIIEAACDRHRGEVDASEVMDRDYPEGSIARLLSSGLFYSDPAMEDGDGSALSEQRTELGVDTQEELDGAFDGMLSSAEKNGISQDGKHKLQDLLGEFRDVFRVRLGPGPPAQVEPMRVTMKPDAVPYMSKVRRYPAEQRDYMKRLVDRLVEFGMAVPNKHAEWTSPPLLVQKPDSTKYRMTFDLRRANQNTKPVAWPMPHIQSELLDFAGSRYFASIAFCAGYWQMPLHEESQGLHSFVTPAGVYKPTRTLQGGMNAVQNFQSRVEPCFQSLVKAVKAWLDDFGVHADSEDGLISNLRIFFTVCRQRNLKVSAKKSVLFDRKLQWCGYIVDTEGVQCDPRRLSGLKTGFYPVTAAELSQFVNCLQWMSTYLPDFASRVAPLRDLLEQAYAKSGKRTSRSIQGIRLSSLSWGPKHANAFDSLQEQLQKAVKIAHRDQKKASCDYTDASDEHWAAIVTQCEQNCLSLPIEEQRHQPLAFLGSAFNETQQHWSTFEKEAYAVFQSFEKMDFMLSCEEDIHLFTDHRNLLFVYNPTALNPMLGRHIVNKVQRWALFLSRFMYTIEHISGERNIAADLMARWYAGYRGRRKGARRITSLMMAEDIVRTPSSEGFDIPTFDMVKTSQLNAGHRPTDLKFGDDGLWRHGNLIWIPDTDIELQMKLLVVSHCGTVGHRGCDSTISRLKEQFYWRSMEADARAFVAGCLHCIIAKSGERVPRPISLTLHGTMPNEVVHFDFIYMGIGKDGLKYLLVIRDDLSTYLWLCPCVAADSEAAAKNISRWIRVFTTMVYWVSDQGPHFKNTAMNTMAKTYNIKHQFAVAYSPWVNGTVEVCMRHIRAACTALLSEFQLGPQDWPSVVDLIMAALNEAPLKRLGSRADGTYRTPLEVMTGIKPARSVLPMAADGNRREVQITQVNARRIIKIDELQEALGLMHKEVGERVANSRLKQVEHHNKRTNLVTPHFDVGDFVVVRRAQNKGHKLQFRWIGPRRISRVISETIYEVTGLIDGKIEVVHAARLMLYRAKLDGSVVSEKLLRQVEHLEANFEMVDKLLDIGEADDGMFIQVQWLGQPHRTDWTWQALKELYEDVPEKVKHFLSTTRKRKLARKACNELKISLE